VTMTTPVTPGLLYFLLTFSSVTFRRWVRNVRSTGQSGEGLATRAEGESHP
jgi:hypothetical protein